MSLTPSPQDGASCQVGIGRDRECGDPSVKVITVAGRRVRACAAHADSLESVADYISNLTKGWS